MFEATLRELKRLERDTRISIPVPLDPNGYVDRMGPDDRCQAHFKVEFGDWKEKLQDEGAFCESGVPRRRCHVASRRRAARAIYLPRRM